MKSCVIYARISQDRTGEHAGVERQLAECRALAESLGLAVTFEYVDNDVSATSGKARPQFEALMKSKPQAIIAWHQDRLLRTGKDIERVIDLGVNVYMVTAGTLDLSTPAGRAVARTIAAWSQYEGEQKAERQKARNRQLASDGLPVKSSRRFGYEPDSLTPRTSEADAIKKAYDDLLNGKSVYQIARYLNANGPKPMRAAQWTTAGVRTLLKRPRNAGLLVYQGEIQPDSKITPIVSRDTFDAAQAILAHPDRMTGKRGPKVVKHWLTGLIVCGVCGSTMSAHKGFYKCNASIERNIYGGQNTRHVSIATHLAEAEAVALLHAKLQDHRDRVETAKSTEIADIRARIAEQNRQRQVVQELALMPGADLTHTQQQLNALSQQISALEGDLAAATMDGATAELMQLSGLLWSVDDRKPFDTFRLHFEALSTDDRRKLFRVLPTPTVTPKVAGKIVYDKYHGKRRIKHPRLVIP